MGLRGPPAKPTELKIARGNPGKRALNHDEPELTAATAAPPKGLPVAARKEWIRLAAELINAGVLSVADMRLFEEYCLLVAEVDQTRKQIKRVGIENAHKLGYKNYLIKSRAQLVLV